MGSVAGSGSGPKAFVSSVRKKPPSCCFIRAFFFFWAGCATNRNSATPEKARMQITIILRYTNIMMHPVITRITPSRIPMLSIL